MWSLKEIELELLRLACNEQLSNTYGELYQTANVNGKDISERNKFANILGEISTRHYWHGLPMISVIVVKKDEDRMPGDGFFELARYLNPDYVGVSDLTIFGTESRAVKDHIQTYCEMLRRYTKVEESPE